MLIPPPKVEVAVPETVRLPSVEIFAPIVVAALTIKAVARVAEKQAKIICRMNLCLNIYL